MSMREYPVVEYGLLLTFENAQKLFKGYIGKDKEEFLENVENGDVFELLQEEFGFDLLIGITGTFINLDEQAFAIYDETFCIIYLDKFDYNNHKVLFDKYENKDECYKEILKKLEYSYHIDIKTIQDNQKMIIENIGRIEGTLFG